jgi:hypothetical protein
VSLGSINVVSWGLGAAAEYAAYPGEPLLYEKGIEILSVLASVRVQRSDGSFGGLVRPAIQGLGGREVALGVEK